MKENNDILVSVCSITYNHAPYIRQCLDGILMQQTDFKYEIIIHDDCSTDGTTEIIREYAAKYPHLFVPIFQTENQYSKGVRGMFATFVFPCAKGKYVAMCEGDDYWIDPLKLQKQVDFLEANPEYSLCFHRVKTIYEKGCNGKDIFAHVSPGEYTLDYILCHWTVPTCSMLSRREVFLSKPENPKFRYGDNVLVLTCFTLGRIYCIDGIMGIYRRHENGWTLNKSQLEIYKEQYVHFCALIESFPTLDLNRIKKEKIYYAANIHEFLYEELTSEIKNLIKKDFMSHPLLFLRYKIALKIKKYIKNKS